MAKGQVCHQVAIQKKVDKAQSMGTKKVEEVLKRNNENKMAELSSFEKSKSNHINFSHKQYCIERKK